MARKWKVAIVAVLILTLIGGGTLWAWRRGADRPVTGSPMTGGSVAAVTLTPVKADSHGVDLASGLLLKSEKALDPVALERALTIQPAVAVTVETKSSQEFLIRPTTLLQANQVYRVALAAQVGLDRAYQWSFQTQATFRILGTLPRNQGAGVPTNTGIELTFSHEDYGDVAPFFSITPAVEGRFERHNRVLAFVPKSPLQPGTVYTVTLKQGMGQTAGDGKLSADYTFTFETQPEGGGSNGYANNLLITDAVAEFTTGQAPYFQTYSSKQTPSSIDGSIYRYPDGAAFAKSLMRLDQIPWWAEFARLQYREEHAGLTQVATFQTKLESYENYMGSYLFFPDALPPGYYLAELTAGDERRQVRFQVTDLSGYISVTDTKTLVWLNDLSTGLPVPGARVSLAAGGDSATTDTGGVAVLQTPAGAMSAENRGGLYLLAQAGEKEAVVAAPGRTISYYGEPQRSLAVQYWRYLYLDRGLYKPNDTVNLWGILRPREKGAQPIAQVTARITRNDYYGADQQPLPLVEATLPVQDSTFTGALRLPGLKPGWYEIGLYAGADLIITQYMEVANYTKPAYQLAISADQQAIFAGEAVTLTAEAAFFEGTPVPGLRLDYSFAKESGDLLTDAGGRASVSLNPSADWNPHWQWYDVRARLPEAGEITASGYVLVYKSDVLLQANVVSQADGKARISGKVNQVDLTGVNAGTTWDVTGAALAGKSVTIDLTEENWIKEERGEYYDFIQKTVHKRYDYRPNHKSIGSFTVTTGVDGTFSYEIAVDPERSYSAAVTVRDSKGNAEVRDLWFSGRKYPGMLDTFYGGRWTYLSPQVGGRHTWQVGEPVTLEMRKDQATIPDRRQGYLFYTTRLGLQSYAVQDIGSFTYALRAEELPATNVRGVYFDGRTYLEASDYQLRVDPQEQALQVAITTDKAAYKPGETVTLAVAVTDRDRNPVRAQLNLNLIDEALYALMDQRVDLLQSLYGEYIPSGILSTRWTHRLPQPGFGAEKGGDGGGARKEFKDAIFFHSVATDGDGKATATFAVPDNLTTWRLTYHAIAPATMTGASGITGVKVTLPFFVESVQGETYLTGDQPAVTARTYGSALQAGEQALLQLSLAGPRELKTPTQTAKAFESTWFNLPKLDQPGRYTTTLSAEGPHSMTDAVAKEFTVVDSYLRQQKVEFQLLEPGAKVKGPAEGTATLLLSDYARGRYLQTLSLLRWQGGNRFEQKLSRWQAAELLKRYGALDEQMVAREPAPDTFAYQAPNGSIAILPYADGDLFLSALAADLLPDGFDQAALELYFTGVLEDAQAGRPEKIKALYGMAAIGRPVLSQAKSLLEAKDLTLDERLHLALALAELGDLEGARPLYWAIIREHGEQLGPDARIKTGRDTDEILSRTALAGMLAAKLGEAEGPAFAGYLLSDWGRDVLLVMEQAIMAADGLANAPAQPVSVTYAADGKEVHQELKPGESKHLTLTASTLRSMEIRAVTGKVGLTALYEAPLTRAELKQQKGFTVKRSYSVEGQETTTLRPGDLVKVTLNYEIPATAPSGLYELTDYLPSGLRILNRPWENGIQWEQNMGWPIEVNGQKATFFAARDAKEKRVVYYARVVTPGEYTAEEPVLQHQRSGLLFASGGRQRVIIK